MVIDTFEIMAIEPVYEESTKNHDSGIIGNLDELIHGEEILVARWQVFTKYLEID